MGFVDRLKLVLEHYELSAASFAEKMGVQRSNISHLLNGRNRPSLDFVMKLVETYPEVDLYWLLNGKGSFPPSPLEARAELSNQGNRIDVDVAMANTTSKEIAKIIIFYADGSFEPFHPKK